MNSKLWIGDEWESHIQRLLLRRYGPGNYQPVPDRHVGDYGLEGFSSDGTAYQCYAPEEPLTIEERYTKCRAKITADISKFIRNTFELGRLLGNVRIRRWVLVTPRHDSASLVQHCARKSAAVAAARLPYVAADFQVVVITDLAFSVELQELAGVGLAPLHYEPDSAELARPEDWLLLSDNVTLVENLNRKSRAVPALQDSARREAFVREVVENYLEGQDALGWLHDDYPELYERAYLLKAAREGALVIESLAGVTGLPGDRLKGEIELFQLSLAGTLSALSPSTAATLALEAISDWLMRCPLDFPGTGNGL